MVVWPPVCWSAVLLVVFRSVNAILYNIDRLRYIDLERTHVRSQIPFPGCVLLQLGAEVIHIAHPFLLHP